MSGIRRRRKKNGKVPKRKNEWKQDGVRQPFKDIVRENSHLEAFYKSLSLCSSEEEYGEMFRIMKLDLPASFRVTGFKRQAESIATIIQGTYFRELSEGARNITPLALPWIPMAWQLNVTRKDIRRNENLFKLHNFLISESESGNITRQETVSMIPPRVLDVQPHHRVLDMCAAPGSKTGQLIEALHAIENEIPKGFLVANDSDNSRCYMLVHQAKRLQSPCVLITNHDASIMPNILVSNEKGQLVDLKYDRILCDVPCSGDGTLRKNADIWTKWTPSTSNNLHGLQYRILKRGLELLALGGRLVYSTCSMNPVEDEAVLCRVLLEAGASVSLIDASPSVHALKYSPGLHTWKIGDKDGQIYSTFEEVPESSKNSIRPFMFPPSAEEASKLHLERSMRILPHYQNTGGFFVAVLEKNEPCNWEKVKNYETGKIKEFNGGDPPLKKSRYIGYKEDPFMYFEENEPVFETIKNYYDLKEELVPKMFLSRCKDTSKRNTLYFSSLPLRDIVFHNSNSIKIINTGVKAFVKCENKGSSCPFRLAQEGSLLTLSFLQKRIIRPSVRDLNILLLNNDIERPPLIDALDSATREQLSSLETGSVGFIYEEENSDKIIQLVGWKGKNSLRCYVPKNERIHYLRLLGGDFSKYETNKYEIRREKETLELLQKPNANL